MSYHNQSDIDHLDIIIGPPRLERLVDAIHNNAVTHEITIDKAWSNLVREMADNFIKPDDAGLSYFSKMFTDFLGQDVRVSEYFLSHYYHCFSTNGQFLSKIKNPAERHEYTAPAINFQSKNILDVRGKPINIRQFDELKRKMIQNLMLLFWEVNWVHVTISYGFTPREKIAA